MTKTEILMAYAKGLKIVHPKTESAYRFGRIVEIKVNGVWSEGMTYYPVNGSRCFLRHLDDFKKFEVYVAPVVQPIGPMSLPTEF